LRAGGPIRMTEGASIDSVLQAALSDERAEATARGVRIELVTDGDHPTCTLDTVLVERAVANLVRNAVAVSTAYQRVRIERDVVVDAPGRPGRWVRVTIADEGPGVPESIRDTLFEPFVTRPVLDTDKTVGIGLGLALAREVANAHGGALDLVPSEGQGARFELWLPALEPRDGEETSAPSVIEASSLPVSLA
jgi:two-component system sensor histidine kinase GlrK